MDVDLVMSIVRLMRRQSVSPDFKIVVMSATLQGKVTITFVVETRPVYSRCSLIIFGISMLVSRVGR